ncbi:MAG: hypothetical protein GY777_22655 [Candidatus Brocadiaceae bacterium]|nr:hypothetical protein [Candidatus Brocadiaceae bacterium]
MKNNYSCLNSHRDRSDSRNVPERFDAKRINLKKKRLCLKCGKMFLSIGPHNRLCENCVSANEKIALKTFNVCSKLPDKLDH